MLGGVLLLALANVSLAEILPQERHALWSRFYAHESRDGAVAEASLRQILAHSPHDLMALKSMLYLKIRTGQPEEAIGLADQVLALDPADDAIGLQKAYLLNGLGRNVQAHAEFTRLRQSSDPEIAATATQAADNLGFAVESHRALRSSFADIYASPSYESRSEAGILPLKLRLGRYYGSEQRGQWYGFASLNRDTRSTGGVRPEVVDENALIVGMGLNYRLATAWPLTAYLELGMSRDLIDRNRSKYRESVVAGLTSFREWGDTSRHCGEAGTGCRFPSLGQRFHADFYGNVATYSRNDYNVIADLRLRPGLNLVKTPQAVVRGYAKVRSSHDTDGLFYNNILEVGPGIAFDLAAWLPLSLHLETVKVFYLRGKAADGRASYHNRRLELTYYRSF